MVKVMLGNKEKIAGLTIIAILMLAAAVYIGERFQPYKIAGNIISYAAVQIAGAGVQTSGKTPTTSQNMYIVKKGDTVWSISRKFGVHPETLKFANYIGSNSKIKTGQKLIIPKKG